jgi:hypothetical protein
MNSKMTTEPVSPLKPVESLYAGIVWLASVFMAENKKER